MRSSGGFGSAIYDAVDTGELTEEEAFLIVRGFLTAGLDTTVSARGSAILCLASNPEQLALLREQPSPARAAFEEAVRIESPVQALFRTTTQAVEIQQAPRFRHRAREGKASVEGDQHSFDWTKPKDHRDHRGH